jgi:hypothetical protein
MAQCRLEANSKRHFYFIINQSINANLTIR